MITTQTQTRFKVSIRDLGCGCSTSILFPYLPLINLLTIKSLEGYLSFTSDTSSLEHHHCYFCILTIPTKDLLSPLKPDLSAFPSTHNVSFLCVLGHKPRHSPAIRYAPSCPRTVQSRSSPFDTQPWNTDNPTFIHT